MPFHAKLLNISRDIAKTAFKNGVPLFDIIKVMWIEYDRCFGWALLTPEQRDALIASVTNQPFVAPTPPPADVPKP